jgi:hypothetical protein
MTEQEREDRVANYLARVRECQREGLTLNAVYFMGCADRAALAGRDANAPHPIYHEGYDDEGSNHA